MGGPGREPTWFEQVSPSLLRNRAIRNYLQTQPARDWPEVLKLTLLYGIVTLGKQYPGRILCLEDLRAILAQNRVAVTVEDAIPDIRDQLDRLQSQLEEVTDEVYQHGEAAMVGDCVARLRGEANA